MHKDVGRSRPRLSRSTRKERHDGGIFNCRIYDNNLKRRRQRLKYNPSRFIATAAPRAIREGHTDANDLCTPRTRSEV